MSIHHNPDIHISFINPTFQQSNINSTRSQTTQTFSINLKLPPGKMNNYTISEYQIHNYPLSLFRSLPPLFILCVYMSIGFFGFPSSLYILDVMDSTVFLYFKVWFFEIWVVRTHIFSTDVTLKHRNPKFWGLNLQFWPLSTTI